MIKLKHIINSVVISEIELSTGTFSIGRNHGNSLQLEDGVVSGDHAVITLQPSPYLPEMFEASIRDLGSTNGTYVNGTKINDQRLKHDDLIRIGSHELKVYDDAANTDTQTEYYVPDENDR